MLVAPEKVTVTCSGVCSIGAHRNMIVHVCYQRAEILPKFRMTAVRRCPAVWAFGIRWLPANPTAQTLMAVMRSAFKTDSWPPAVYCSDNTVDLRPSVAYWLCNNTTAVWALQDGLRIRIITGVQVGISINGNAPVWIGAGCGVEIIPKSPPPWKLSVVSINSCTPVIVHRQLYADALLNSPGCNLAIPKTPNLSEWTDAVIMDNKANFVCGGCLKRFSTLEQINSHFVVKLIAADYVSLLPETKSEAAAGYTPDMTNKQT